MGDKRFDIVKETARLAIHGILHPTAGIGRGRHEEPLAPLTRVALQLEAMVALAELRLELARDLKAYLEAIGPEERAKLTLDEAKPEENTEDEENENDENEDGEDEDDDQEVR